MALKDFAFKVLDTDDKGNPTTKLRLDIPKQID